MSANAFSETCSAPGRWPTPSCRRISLVAVAFGLMTILGGGGMLLDGDATRRIAGDHVTLVIWFNVLAGFTYVVAGIGIWKQAAWSVALSIGIFVATADVLAALVVYALAGGSCESRTVAVMTLRTVVWLALALGARRSLPRSGIGGDVAAGPSLRVTRERGRP